MAGKSESDLPSSLPTGTRLESVEEIRRARQQDRARAALEQMLAEETQPFTPARRPPQALLWVLDDGSDDGELVRIRDSRFVIGRDAGDLHVPHDEMISSQHAEIRRQTNQGRHRWYLNDLNSTNGTFVRITNAVLRHGQELLLGGRRYRFHVGVGPLLDPEEPGPVPTATAGWNVLALADLPPALVELKPNGEEVPRLLAEPPVWIGRDPRQCSLAIQDDLLLEPRHACLRSDGKGHWRLESTGTLNGVWLRVRGIPVEGMCQFQLGEQRFVLRTS